MENLKRPVILVVDDDQSSRDLIRAYLGSVYDLLEAGDGAQALALLQRQSVDLVLLDVMMPQVSGYEVCRQIKDRPQEHYLPVILLTSLDQQEDRIAGLQAGADDFLIKPVDRSELLLRVQVFIKLKQQEENIRAQLADRWRQEHLIQCQMEELRAVDSLKDDLASLMAHDLGNPLTGVRGLLDGVGNNVPTTVGASGRLKETLEDILNVRMLESGTVPIHPEMLEVAVLVRDAIASMWGAARARQIEISPVIDLTKIEVAADRKLLRRAIENLLSNALKYSPFGGVIVTTVHDVDGHIEIEVGDRGRGIPDNLKAQLFEKFTLFEAARGIERRGIGLGLYLVKLVATAHGGRALVRDREGGGTTFGLWLPRPEMPVAAPRA